MTVRSMFIGVFAFLMLAMPVLCAKEKVFASGTVICIEPIRPSLPIRLPSAAQTDVRVTAGYQFCIRHHGNLVYLGFCQNPQCQVDWHVGDEIEYRLSGNKIYLKRPNRKELRLDLTAEAKVDADGKLVDVIHLGRKRK